MKNKKQTLKGEKNQPNQKKFTDEESLAFHCTKLRMFRNVTHITERFKKIP